MKTFMLLLGFLIIRSDGIRAEEKTIKVDDLPKAVSKAWQSKYPQGKYIKAVQEEEDNETYYDVIVALGDKGTFEVKISPEGKIVKEKATSNDPNKENGKDHSGKKIQKQKQAKLSGLPMAVAVVGAKYPKGELIKAIKEDDDETVYEVVVEMGEKTLEVSVSPKGRIIEVEQTISVEEMPKRVVAALKSKFPKARIKSAEQVTKYEDEDDEQENDEEGDDKDDEQELQYFEVVLKSKGKAAFEVKITANGKFIEEDAEDEDDKPSKKAGKE